MSSLVAALLLVVSLASDALLVGVDRSPEELAIRFELLVEMPEAVANTISSGARIEIDYPLRVYARRRMFPDRRIWKGVARSTVTFDAITGRYLCQLIVNGSTTVSREVDSVEFALQWLTAPPAVEVPLPKGRRAAFLRVRARAVFSSGTTWLVFPSTEGTDWVEVKLEAQRDEE
ncbi:MAG: DUF4390 domain-containing protein [Acidobacteria bacterium]|uniref:DUF4390 domain-containing protein n=1 Tax=Candidatus Sulfomarinibacter kjeldsenii TaxID=2885994 RepID=A0A8J6Y7F9_9BACT|nr:DUF4390 domain-containing protein [Candidatus Sulfomarinibacter kjeldsenii]MBD3871029.1 DUF4390 domain-containing protein [Candidatus Sulfomarinibacter kjeldsenii]